MGEDRTDDRGDSERPLAAAGDAPLAERPGEPPVVARMVVEIRSDGSRTIARGAIEDVANGERVGIEAEGTTPLALARSLAASMFMTPSLVRSVSRAPSLIRTALAALLPGKRDGSGGRR